MKLRYTCDCGHENLWPVFERKISNFVCEGCGEFIGAYGNDDLKFADGKGIGLYKKYDSITEELVLMRYRDNYYDSRIIEPLNIDIVWSPGRPIYATTWDGQHININMSNITTSNTNYHTHAPSTVTYQWHRV